MDTLSRTFQKLSYEYSLYILSEDNSPPNIINRKMEQRLIRAKKKPWIPEKFFTWFTICQDTMIILNDCSGITPLRRSIDPEGVRYSSIDIMEHRKSNVSNPTVAAKKIGQTKSFSEHFLHWWLPVRPYPRLHTEQSTCTMYRAGVKHYVYDEGHTKGVSQLVA